MIALLHTGALFCYLAAVFGLAAAFAGRTGWPASSRGLAYAAGAGLVLHAAGIVAFTRAFDELPLVGLAPSLGTIAFIIAVLAVSSALLSDSRSIALLLLPVVVLMLGGALLMGMQPAGQDLAFRGPWFVLHVILAFAAYAGLTLSAAAGLLYLLQFRELKEKHLGRIFRFFPPLPTLDAVGKAGLLVAFPCLTLALGVGWSWTLRFGQATATEGAQVIWGVLTWIVFAGIVLVRTTSIASRERRAALASVLGFVIVVLAYVVLRVSPAAGGGFL